MSTGCTPPPCDFSTLTLYTTHYHPPYLIVTRAQRLTKAEPRERDNQGRIECVSLSVCECARVACAVWTYYV